MQPIGVASHPPKEATQGFTMVELLIVLVILAILSAIALPNLRSGMRREQLAATSLGLINWLERARNQAVKDMESCQLSIDTDDASDATLAITSDSPGCKIPAPSAACTPRAAHAAGSRAAARNATAVAEAPGWPSVYMFTPIAPTS